MNALELTKFKEEFKHIIYLHSKIVVSTKRLCTLEVWNKKDSHHTAIIKEIEMRNKFKKELTDALKGLDYNDWLLISKKISALTSKLKTALEAKHRYEKLLNEIKLPL